MLEHIVILGGGFGGWYAARALALRLRSPHTVTLIDRVDHMLYTPMLTEAAGGNVPPQSIAVPMRDLPRRANFVQGDIQAIDIAAKQVTLATGQVITATQLVFALGSATAYHGVDGAKENSLPLKTLEDSQRLLARTDQLIDEAAQCTDPERRQQLLTLVVAGGGYTGVETIAAVAEHMAERAASVGIDPEEVHAVLIEPTQRLMNETAEPLALYSQHQLEHDGVRVILGVGVQKVEGDTVILSSGEQIRAGLLVWDTGIEPSPLLKQTSLPLGKKHGVTVDSCFRVIGHTGLWAIGDCAEIPQPDGGSYATTAQNATREGVHLAQNISATLRGEQPRPFRFTMLGQLALLSHGVAVAEILGVQLTGRIACALWWLIYIAKLPYTPGRITVARTLVERRLAA